MSAAKPGAITVPADDAEAAERVRLAIKQGWLRAWGSGWRVTVKGADLLVKHGFAGNEPPFAYLMWLLQRAWDYRACIDPEKYGEGV